MKTRAKPPRAFGGPAAFRAWLEESHDRVSELLVRCYKSHAKDRGLTYPQAVDEALCFGWIDGVRRSVDDRSFSVRFSPRKPRSGWSAINLARFAALKRAGRVRPPGLRAHAARVKPRYSYESKPQALPPAYLARLRANERARRFYEAQAPWYRRTTAFWIMSAKQKETRERRLSKLIDLCAQGRAVPPLEARPQARP